MFGSQLLGSQHVGENIIKLWMAWGKCANTRVVPISELQIGRYLKRMLLCIPESPEADNATRFVLDINPTHRSDSRCLALSGSRTIMRIIASYVSKIRNEVIRRYKLCYFKLLPYFALIISPNVRFVIQNYNTITNCPSSYMNYMYKSPIRHYLNLQLLSFGLR